MSCDLSGRDECFLFGPTRLTQQAAGVNGKQPEWTLLNAAVNVAGKPANKRDKHGGAVNRAPPEGLLYFMGVFAESFFFLFSFWPEYSDLKVNVMFQNLYKT